VTFLEAEMNALSELELRVIEQFHERESKILSELATFSKDGVRRHPEKFPNIRPHFSRDGDRILHSFAFTRYIDKTQVFYLSENDVITHRIIHVQLVSKIGRIIARALRLNEDLVEAIALGHDIGHTPFGHEGEENLSGEITEKLQEEPFHFRHSVQSVRFLDELEGKDYLNQGRRSLNLTLQVLDGILCHDGEELRQSIRPRWNKTWEDFDREVAEKKAKQKVEILPMTLEACLVRFVDVIAYVGRDVEDAVEIGLVKREDFSKVLGDKNREIVNNLAMDIIENSLHKDEICYSKERFEQLKFLQAFNYQNIYKNPLIKTQKDKIKDMLLILYRRLVKDVKEKNTDSPIFLDHIHFIDRGDPKRSYYNHTPPEIIVVDYISGMTDDYFVNTFNEIFFPRKLPFNFRQVERLTGLPKEKLMSFLNEEGE
jgi:dGTPase